MKIQKSLLQSSVRQKSRRLLQQLLPMIRMIKSLLKMPQKIRKVNLGTCKQLQISRMTMSKKMPKSKLLANLQWLSQPLQEEEAVKEISVEIAKAIEEAATLVAEETETRVDKWFGKPRMLMRKTKIWLLRKKIRRMTRKNQVKSLQMMMNRLMQM